MVKKKPTGILSQRFDLLDILLTNPCLDNSDVAEKFGGKKTATLYDLFTSGEPSTHITFILDRLPFKVRAFPVKTNNYFAVKCLEMAINEYEVSMCTPKKCENDCYVACTPNKSNISSLKEAKKTLDIYKAEGKVAFQKAATKNFVNAALLEKNSWVMLLRGYVPWATSVLFNRKVLPFYLEDLCGLLSDLNQEDTNEFLSGLLYLL